MDTVGIALAGIGRWAAEVHIPNLLLIPSFRITALWSRSESSRLRGAAACGTAPRLCSSFDELIASPDIEAVLIATPNDTHASLATQALQAGKHVFCEKPMALTIAEARAVAQTAGKSGKVYMTGLELRCSDVAQSLRRLIAGGTLGRLRTIAARLFRPWALRSGWRSDPEVSGGVFAEMNSHYADLICFLADVPPVCLSAFTTSLDDPRRSTDVLMSVEFQGHTVGSVQMILGACGPPDSTIGIDVVGERGRASAEVNTGRLLLWEPGAERPKDISPARPPGYKRYGFPGSREILDAFAAAVMRGAPVPCGCDVALLSVRMADACARSAAERVTVPLQD